MRYLSGRYSYAVEDLEEGSGDGRSRSRRGYCLSHSGGKDDGGKEDRDTVNDTLVKHGDFLDNRDPLGSYV